MRSLSALWVAAVPDGSVVLLLRIPYTHNAREWLLKRQKRSNFVTVCHQDQIITRTWNRYSLKILPVTYLEGVSNESLYGKS